MHRLRGDGVLDNRWSVISITTYNTAVLVRFATLKLPQDQETRIYKCWDHEIKASLSLIRHEALINREEGRQKEVRPPKAVVRPPSQAVPQSSSKYEINGKPTVQQHVDEVEIVEL